MNGEVQQSKEQMLFDTATRIVGLAGSRGISLRLFGAIACWGFASECRNLPAFQRERQLDIDFVSDCNSEERIAGVFSPHGFSEPTTDFYQLGFRMNFVSRISRMERTTAHVYAGRVLRLSHPLPIELAASNGSISLNPTDLLLTKVAIHKFAEKDVLDCAMMLHDVPVDTENLESISSEGIARRCSKGWRAWGLFEDVRRNLQNVTAYVSEQARFCDSHRARIIPRTKSLLSTLQDFPKPLRWRARALFGHWLPWFDEVDDTE